MFAHMGISRRDFLVTSGTLAGAAALGGWQPLSAATGRGGRPSQVALAELRQAVVDTPLSIGLHRAQVFTRVFQQHEDQPWIVRKALALREYFRTVPLYIRPGDGLAGSISEKPGALPVPVELGIGENNIYTSERPDRRGYLKDQVPRDIRQYWMNRNMFGQFRTEIMGLKPFTEPEQVPAELGYKFLSNQGHLCPSYGELLKVGLGGMLQQVRQRRQHAGSADQQAFLTAAEEVLLGVSEWAARYAAFLAAEAKTAQGARAAELTEMGRVTGNVAQRPPETFREALQLLWLVHQAIHIEGHGYSCTPDRVDQLLWPFYQADRQAGRLNEAQTRRLCENFVLKLYDNGFWGPEHHLTQGLCVGGSTPDGTDQTNRLSWLFVEAATNLALPEPLVWMRWHPAIDQDFFDFCLTRLPRSTCFPMIWNDKAVTAALMQLGISRDDAFDFMPVGCNELAVPGRMYFNPGAHANYLQAVEATLTSGRGLRGQWKWKNVAPAAAELTTFDEFAAACGAYLRAGIERSYAGEMQNLKAQMRWGQTPLTSCFFHGCIAKAQDLTAGTKYNILSCGGIALANAVDCLAAVRQVVYQQHAATLEEVARACAADFVGFEPLRAKLLAAPKHGNDDPRLDDVVRLVERLRDEPLKEICRDPRDGTPMGNSHVVRSAAVKQGLVTPATPDGRKAGTPLASSVAASAGCERTGPTALLNSVCKLDGAKSWQCGYQVNIRLHAGMIVDDGQREKLRAMLNVYFQKGGQELQINVVDTATLRAAQKNPEAYRDVVVRVAGFSEFFVNLTPEMQEEIIARTEYR